MKTSDWINSVVAVATVVMAFATYYLAKITKCLAQDTRDATKQANRHHQENLRPFCLIAFFNSNQQFPFGSNFDPETRRREALMTGSQNITQSPHIHVLGELLNKGNGPATDVFVYLNARRGEGDSNAFRLTRPVVASGLVGSGEEGPLNVQITQQDIMPTWKDGKWNPTQVFQAIAGETYEVVLEYKDVFGNPFRTVHPRGIWTHPVPNVEDQETREKMMTRPDRLTPIFLTGTQAVRTLADAPSLPRDFPAEWQSDENAAA
jgi:hypothetical protein